MRDPWPMKIAIVNDMPLEVEALRQILKTVNDYEVVWVATNGAEAVQKCAALRPDVILMDLFMPVMDGVEATRSIMKTCPCGILLVTSSIQANLSQIFTAMCCGALDVVVMPVLGTQDPRQAGAAVLLKIAIIGKLIAHPKQSLGRNLSRSKLSLKNLPLPNTQPQIKTFPKPLTAEKSLQRRASLPPLVVIGASAGGPKALATVLSQLPSNFGAAVAIAQHIDTQFAPGLASWLDSQTPLTVELAKVGEKPQVGKVLMAGRNDHLILNSNQTFSYSSEPKNEPYRPSVNALFTSLANHWPRKAIAVLLTGMGSDGALGLKRLRSQGWHTIAQDRESCAVYGMPKAAVKLDAAEKVLPLEAIGPKLIDLVSNHRSKFFPVVRSQS